MIRATKSDLFLLFINFVSRHIYALDKLGILEHINRISNTWLKEVMISIINGTEEPQGECALNSKKQDFNIARFDISR